MLKRLLWLLAFTFFFSSALFAQQLEPPTTVRTSSTSCLNSNCAEVSMRGVPVAGINVAGAGTYTLQIEASKNEGTTWYAFNALDESDPSALVTSITAEGNFNVVNSGITNLRVRASAYTSGTPVITLTRGYLEAINTLGGTGGGGGGTAATEYTEGASDATITGVVAMMEDANTIRPLQGTLTDGLLVNLGANNDVTVTGTVTVTDGSGALNTIIDSGTVTAVTSITNPVTVTDGSGSLNTIVDSGTITAVTSITNPVTVTATNLDVQIGGSDTVAVSNAGTFVVQENGAALTALQLIDNLVTTEDTASGNADSGLVAFARRTATPANTSGTDGDYEAFQISAGRLWTSTVLTDGTDTALIDGSGNLQITGAVSCSNCTGSGASKVDDAAFTIATDSVAPAGFLADQTLPDSVNEGDVGLARMTLARIQLNTLWDAAGNERGANVNASGELNVALSTVPSHAVTNAGTFVVQENGAALTALQLIDNIVFAEDAAHVSGDSGVAMFTVRRDTTPSASSGTAGDYQLAVTDANGRLYTNTTLYDASGSAITLGSDTTIGSAISTTGPTGIAVYSDFDGAALPTATNVDTEGEGVPIAASIKGVQYMMLVSEDGSLQYGTSTTPLIVGDGTGALNVICDSGCSGGTQYTQDAALTVGSTIGTMAMGRASAAAPTDVSADNDAVLPWYLRSGALVNQPSYGGVLASANSGNVGTGVPRVVIATDQPAMVGLGIYAEDAAETAGGNLAMSGTVRRDTAASSAGTTGDNATLNTDASGKLWISGAFAEDVAHTGGDLGLFMLGRRIDTLAASSGTSGDYEAVNVNGRGAVWTSPTPNTSGGLLIYRSIDLDEGTGEVIKASPGQLYSMWVTNTATTTRFIKIYNATSCTIGTGTPVMTIGIPGNSSDDIVAAFTAGGYGIEFSTGICFGAVTGVADNDTGAPGTNDIIVNALYF